MKRIKLLIVDDSAVVRKVLTELFESDPALHVIGAVADPIFAMKHMDKQWPDVIVLDVEMPRMDGITFLRKLMAEHPTPVVMCSTLTEDGAETTMQAIQAGAVGIMAKPKLGLKSFLQDQRAMFIDAVKAAAVARLGNLRTHNMATKATKKEQSHKTNPPAALPVTTERIVAMGTSTGGTQALEQVLSSLPKVSPGILVVQHMPERFTKAFAERLNSICNVEVREAQHGDRLTPGRVLIAPGGQHMSVRRSGGQYHVDVKDGPVVNRHRPSVDVLFRSVAKQAGKNALGIIMTGMGDDGARGLLAMRQAGGRAIAQDEATSVVFGMPKEAIKLNAVDEILPLASMAGKIVAFGSKKVSS